MLFDRPISPYLDRSGCVGCRPDFDPIPDADCHVRLGHFLVWPSNDILRLGSSPICLGARPFRHVIVPHHPANYLLVVVVDWFVWIDFVSIFFFSKFWILEFDSEWSILYIYIYLDEMSYEFTVHWRPMVCISGSS